jgi:tRNA A-37 threonylcarbamoyl transferase component Bud32
MHDNGFLHNDLHGGNVLVNKRNGKFEFYISDFGLIKNMKEEKNDNLDNELKYFKANLASLFSWKDAQKENEIEFISKFILANHKIII